MEPSLYFWLRRMELQSVSVVGQGFIFEHMVRKIEGRQSIYSIATCSTCKAFGRAVSGWAPIRVLSCFHRRTVEPWMFGDGPFESLFHGRGGDAIEAHESPDRVKLAGVRGEVENPHGL